MEHQPGEPGFNMRIFDDEPAGEALRGLPKPEQEESHQYSSSDARIARQGVQLTIESLRDTGHGELVQYLANAEARCCPSAFFLRSTRARALLDAALSSRTIMFTPLVQGKESRIVDGARCDCCSIGDTHDAR